MKYTYDVKQLKKAYNVYLYAKFPKLHPKTLKTRADDVFVMFKWFGDEDDTWEFLLSSKLSYAFREKFLVENFLGHRKNPIKDAKGYCRAIREFRKFIDILEAIERAKVSKARKVN